MKTFAVSGLVALVRAINWLYIDNNERLLQFTVYQCMFREITHFETAAQGWAVRTAEPIKAGTFVCEYIGEVINDREANQRGVRLDLLFIDSI